MQFIPLMDSLVMRLVSVGYILQLPWNYLYPDDYLLDLYNGVTTRGTGGSVPLWN